jgi:hypothetical protein
MKNNENVRLKKLQKGKNCLHLDKKRFYTEGSLFYSELGLIGFSRI